MSENIVPELRTNSSPTPADRGGGNSFVRNVWQVIKTVQARLRFIVVLAAIGGVIVYWDTLKAHYEKWTRPPSAPAAAASDTQFWCPMHPTIVRDEPGKCPICAMPLSARKKGDKGGAETLPAGVVSRVQLTPYRVALAGVKTLEVDYRRLFKEIRTVGSVEFDERKLARISVRPTGRSRIDKLFVNVTGQTVKEGEPLALLYSPELMNTAQNLLDAHRVRNEALERMNRSRLRLWGIDDVQIDDIVKTGKEITHLTIRSPISGHVIRKYQVEGEYVEEGSRLYDVADLHTVWIEAQVYEDELAFLKEGLSVEATTRSSPNRAFRGKLAFIHPHLDAGTRTLTVRFDMDNAAHELRPGMYATVTLQIPASQLDLFAQARLREWRDGTASSLAFGSLFAPASASGSAALEPLLRFAARTILDRRGLVLAVPERAVIDTGSRKLVYREAEPNVYEGVEVELGLRCGDFYPVVRGLEAGDRVVGPGSFLIDAETRLTAGASSTYFGASGGPQDERRSASSVRASTAEDEDSKVKAVRAKLSRVDQRLVAEQEFCPILEDNRLGSMGTPVKIVLGGRPVFLCCKSCIDEAKAHPEQTVEKTEQLKARGVSSPPK